MPNQFTDVQFSVGMDHLVQEGLRLPHGLPAGTFPGGVYSFHTSAAWAAYQWNPQVSFPTTLDFRIFQHETPKPVQNLHGRKLYPPIKSRLPYRLTRS